MLQLDELHDVDGDLDSIEMGSPLLDLLVGICPPAPEHSWRPHGTKCVLISQLRQWIDHSISCAANCNS